LGARGVPKKNGMFGNLRTCGGRKKGVVLKRLVGAQNLVQKLGGIQRTGGVWAEDQGGRREKKNDQQPGAGDGQGHAGGGGASRGSYFEKSRLGELVGHTNDAG